MSFVIEANIKALYPKSSRSQLVKMMNRGPVIWGRVEYRVDYQILGEFLGIKTKDLMLITFFQRTYGTIHQTRIMA